MSELFFEDVLKKHIHWNPESPLGEIARCVFNDAVEFYSSKQHCTQCEIGQQNLELIAEVERLKGDGYISIKDSMPSCKNGFIDTSVIVCVKNKNKDGGIFLYDIASFDGEKWSHRTYTWEDILFWRPIPCKR